MGFQAPITAEVFETPVSSTFLKVFATGDFNGDSHVDVLAGLLRFPLDNTDDPLRLFLGDGAGGLTQAAILGGTSPGAVHPQKILVADFNGDGVDDAFVADHGYDSHPFPGHVNLLLLSDGDGNLVNTPENIPSALDFTHSAALADIDGDDDIDICVGNLGASYFLINDGSGDFEQAGDRVPQIYTGTGPGALTYTTSELADTDDDGDMDLILGGWNHPLNPSVILLNDGEGNFDTVQALPAKPFGTDAIALDIEAVDLNADGQLDIVITYTDGSPLYTGRYMQLLIQQSDGSFVDETQARLTQSTSNANAWQVFTTLMDIDGDGDLDLAQHVDPSGQVFKLYLNNGNGFFTDTPDTIDAFRFAFGDFNGDGLPDLVTDGATGNTGQITLEVLLNDGAWTDPVFVGLAKLVASFVDIAQAVAQDVARADFDPT